VFLFDGLFVDLMGGFVFVFLEMMGFCNLYFGDENGE
jgi:hypothetical protein